MLQNLDAYRLQAQKSLPNEVWRYLDDPGENRNTQALKRVALMPRPLRIFRSLSTQLTLFGQSFDHPIILAPVAYQKLFHPDGELASAMAASAQRAQVVISSLASCLIEDIVACFHQEVAAVNAAPAPWFQLYWQAGKDATLQLLQRAESAGCSAVVLTVDAPAKVASLQLPAGIHAVNLAPALQEASPGGFGIRNLMVQAPTWDDVAWLRRQTKLPLIVKGMLHPDDAAQAVDLGCDGVVVSNHGSRTLPAAPASIDCLPAVVQRVNGQVPVLFDSGVRTGQDVFAALAQGASAVLVGRPYIWALAADGAMGVAHLIRLMRDELEIIMALTGCAGLKDIGTACLHGA